jgi:hypothetical protein
VLGRVRDAIARTGIALTYVNVLDDTLGQSRGGAIEVVSNLSSATEFVTLATSTRTYVPKLVMSNPRWTNALLHEAGTRRLTFDGRRPGKAIILRQAQRPKWFDQFNQPASCRYRA